MEESKLCVFIDFSLFFGGVFPYFKCVFLFFVLLYGLWPFLRSLVSKLEEICDNDIWKLKQETGNMKGNIGRILLGNS